MATKTSQSRFGRFLWAVTICALAVLPIFVGQSLAQDSKRIRIGYSALSLSFLPQLNADAGRRGQANLVDLFGSRPGLKLSHSVP